MTKRFIIEEPPLKLLFLSAVSAAHVVSSVFVLSLARDWFETAIGGSSLLLFGFAFIVFLRSFFVLHSRFISDAKLRFIEYQIQISLVWQILKHQIRKIFVQS